MSFESPEKLEKSSKKWNERLTSSKSADVCTSLLERKLNKTILTFLIFFTKNSFYKPKKPFESVSKLKTERKSISILKILSVVREGPLVLQEKVRVSVKLIVSKPKPNCCHGNSETSLTFVNAPTLLILTTPKTSKTSKNPETSIKPKTSSILNPKSPKPNEPTFKTRAKLDKVCVKKPEIPRSQFITAAHEPHREDDRLRWSLGYAAGDPRLQLQDQLVRSGDVERNPGPETKGGKERETVLKVISYNVRGLNDENKLRHLINYLYQSCRNKNSDFVACLQETYLTKAGKIPFLWRGNSEITQGNGNSCGCITFLSPHLNVLRATSIDDRGHVLAVQRTGETEVAYVIANVYAPNPNSNEKLSFFERVFDQVNEFKERFNCNNVLVLGDFNLNFSSSEMKNRAYSVQEKRLASIVKDMADQSDLKDCLTERPTYTWRRPNSETFSTIDRILFSCENLKLISCRANWSLSFSDHAAVEAGFDRKDEKLNPRSKITRLDPSLAKDPDTGRKITEEFREMLATMPSNWEPFNKLEFSKVCIRTVVERVQAERKKLEKGEEDLLNEELDCAIEQLAKNELNNVALIEHIEDLRNRKSILVERKGKRLAERLGTKWYNEGEKSNKYFMRLLNRANPDHFKKIERAPGEVLTDQDKIEKEIVSYYKKLYEDFDGSILVDNDDEFFNEVQSISDDDDREISRPITTEELRKTLHTCEDSSPGPDGIPYSIIGLLWTDFGPILAEAWNHSIITGTLAPSHKTSYLKLIPKAGKNPDKLTNWRPITLSNCDHKLITKTYSRRICEKVAPCIDGGQTAYLKGRLINDNLRSLLATIEASNAENDLNGIIVALDAKKAFDSVSHEYIENCLKSFGCKSFIPIFRILYSDLQTDILINGKVVKGYKIRRGVKQGDALSCILFIMCIEPLLKNIKVNNDIEALTSAIFEMTLPKTYAYADDVSGTIKDNERSLQAFFYEYERLTRKSGLELNADKTEILRIRGDNQEKLYNVNYLNKLNLIQSTPEVKINGIFLCRDLNAARERNVDAVIAKMERHYQSWSRRSLSILGKVLIAKSFGLSQAIYLMQTLTLSESDLKKLNAVTYKFIWNKHYQAAKAPERIKREIMCKGIKLGGFGMLDITELDKSIKIRAVGRLLGTCHPFMNRLKLNLNLRDFFHPRCRGMVDGVLARGVDLVKADRNKLWSRSELDRNRELMLAIRDTKIAEVLNLNGRNSVIFYIISRQATFIKDLNLAQLAQLERYVNEEKIVKLRLAVSLNLRGTNNLGSSYFTRGCFKPLEECTSKEIRTARSDPRPITEFKVGLNLTISESLSWLKKVAKLTNIRHRNTLLRVAHGEIYTKVRLARFGLTNDPKCPRCDQLEDLAHKIQECIYTKKIWQECTTILKERLMMHQEVPLKNILGASSQDSMMSLTIKAEILQRILQLKDEPTYLIRPKIFVTKSIELLIKRENSNELKERLKDLLLE